MLNSRNRFSIFLILFVVGFCIFASMIATDFGLSWDEPMRYKSGDQKLAYYEELLSSEEPLQVMRNARRDVYPALYDLPLAYARKHFDVSPFVLSRVWNTIWSALGLLGTVILMRRLLVLNNAVDNSRAQSLFDDLLPFLPALILLLSPEFFAHLFINPKDMPFATTYTWGVLALVYLFTVEVPRKEWVLLGVSIGLALAMRPPGVIIYAYFGLFSLIIILMKFASDRSSGLLKPIAGLAGRSIGLAALALVVAFPWWPALHRNPFTATGTAVSRLHNVANSKPVLFQGQFFDAGEIPVHYTIWMLLAKIPEWFALLLIASVLIGVFRRNELVDRFRRMDIRVLGVAIVAFALIFPVLYVTLSRAAIHNGYRHMLYTLPVAAIMAAFAWRHLFITTADDSRRRMLLSVASAAFVLFSVFNLYRLHPYQYVYYNALAGGTAGSYGSYETEYWFTSGKEAAESLNALAKMDVGSSLGNRVFVMGPVDTVRPFLEDSYDIVQRLEEADYYVGRRTNADFMRGSKLVHSIERAGLPILVVAVLKH